MAAGSHIDLTLFGGGVYSGSPTITERDEQPAPVAHSTIARLSDLTRANKWIVVILMGAALAFGLISAFAPRNTSK